MNRMDYFQAVQEGRARVGKALELLQQVAGPCQPLLFLKMGVKEWTPVGDELLYSLVPGKNETASVILCDYEGNSKAMSSWVPRSEAESFVQQLSSRGLKKFEGEVKLPI